MEYSSSALPQVQHGLAASTKQLCLEISSLATVPVSWSKGGEAVAAPLCAPLTQNSSSCLLIHPTLPLLLGLSSVPISDVPMAPCKDLFLFIYYSAVLVEHKPAGTSYLGTDISNPGIQRKQTKGCCHYSTSQEYPVSLPPPTSHPKCASKQALCSLNRVATVYTILPHLFFAPAVPGRRCH